MSIKPPFPCPLVLAEIKPSLVKEILDVVRLNFPLLPTAFVVTELLIVASLIIIDSETLIEISPAFPCPKVLAEIIPLFVKAKLAAVRFNSPAFPCPKVLVEIIPPFVKVRSAVEMFNIPALPTTSVLT